jgi:hypothetical protein
MAPVQIDGQTVADTAPAAMADQSWRCRPDGVFGQTNGMHAGDGEFRAMSTCDASCHRVSDALREEPSKLDIVR